MFDTSPSDKVNLTFGRYVLTRDVMGNSIVLSDQAPNVILTKIESNVVDG